MMYLSSKEVILSEILDHYWEKWNNFQFKLYLDLNMKNLNGLMFFLRTTEYIKLKLLHK